MFVFSKFNFGITLNFIYKITKNKTSPGSLNEPDGVISYIATATSEHVGSLLAGLQISMGNKREREREREREQVLRHFNARHVNIPHGDTIYY